jgi:hypothetical protein
MSIQHTARTGKTYYLHVGQGKSGKPNYFFSTDQEGPLADCLPPGFEIYENINGQVFLRRKLPRLITEEEMARVKEALKRHAEGWRYKVEVKKNTIIIYEASDNSALLEEIALPWVNKAALRQSLIQGANYTAVMRFVLTDPEKRLFGADRFCFRGSIDDWIGISRGSERLDTIIKRFIKHLGKESFFELF